MVASQKALYSRGTRSGRRAVASGLRRCRLGCSVLSHSLPSLARPRRARPGSRTRQQLFPAWLDDELGGGLWYDNERTRKSLYSAAIVASALSIAEVTEDAAMKDKALGCYRWMEAELLRPDGLYWTDRDRQGPVGRADPDRIGEASSVTFLAGNMGMGVLHARLYRLTGDKLFSTVRSARPTLSRKNSLSTAFTSMTATPGPTANLPAIGRPTCFHCPASARHRELLFRTATSIDQKARTSQGYYGGSWSGPAEGPGSRWCTRGSRPQQITTSASSVNMIVAAALAARD